MSVLPGLSVLSVQLPGCGDDLPAAPVDGLVGDDSVQDFELAVPDGFLAERALSRAPLESLDNAVLDRAQESLVNLRGESVIHKNVRTLRKRQRLKVKRVLLAELLMHYDYKCYVSACKASLTGR